MIDSHLEEKLTDLDKNMDRINRVIGKLKKTGTNAFDNNLVQVGNIRRHRTYVEVLIAPPSHANPKLVAKERIKARQLILEEIDEDSKL